MHMFSSSRRMRARSGPSTRREQDHGQQTVARRACRQASFGGIEVVDLSARLGPDTPIIKLPPELDVDTPKIEIHNISNDDKNVPVWAWNWLKLGEHSGTHFDAPIHWITGKDYTDGATDTIPVQKFVGPVNVIDCSRESAADHDFLLTGDHIK